MDKVIVVAHSLGAQVALRAARARPGMVRAMVLVAPAVLNPLDSKFVMGRDPDANLFSAILNLRTRVEMTAKLAAFNLQVCQETYACVCSRVCLCECEGLSYFSSVDDVSQEDCAVNHIGAVNPALVMRVETAKAVVTAEKKSRRTVSGEAYSRLKAFFCTHHGCPKR